MPDCAVICTREVDAWGSGCLVFQIRSHRENVRVIRDLLESDPEAYAGLPGLFYEGFQSVGGPLDITKLDAIDYKLYKMETALNADIILFTSRDITRTVVDAVSTPGPYDRIPNNYVSTAGSILLGLVRYAGGRSQVSSSTTANVLCNSNASCRYEIITRK